MRRLKKGSIFILALCAVALVAPSMALATGPSAGDQQYIDPLGGGHHHSGGSGGSGGSSSGSSSGSTSSSGSSSTAPSSGTTPTATTGSSSGTPVASSTQTSGGTSTGSSGQLPFTGFNAWLAAAIGLGLVGAGIVVRWRLAYSRRG